MIAKETRVLLDAWDDNALLASLTSEDRDRVFAACELVELRFGDVLSEPEEPSRHVYFPIEGFVSQFAAPDAADELEVGLVGNEGMYGVEVALGVHERPLRCVVHGAGRALRMRAEDFSEVLEEAPSLKRVVDRYMAVMLTQFAQIAACTRFHLVEERLARWLLMTQDRSRNDHVHLTHALLAQMLGVRRSGVSTAAAALQARGLIGYSRGDIEILDREGLEAASCECYRAARLTYERMLGSEPGAGLVGTELPPPGARAL